MAESDREAADRDGLAAGALDLGERLTLIAEVGSGGSASVWRAETSSGQAVALKVGHDRSQAPRLALEAVQSHMALSPRLPELMGLGTVVIDPDASEARIDDTGLPFIALRWIDGGTLAAAMGKRLRQRSRLALSLAHGVASALADLHDAGLAHGDVKPDNIAVGAKSVAKPHWQLIDLGLATSAFSESLLGATPRYLARGDRSLGDARARDLLALGLVIAEVAFPSVSKASEPLPAAREACNRGDAVSRIAAALLAGDPGARPSARWVCAIARAALEDTAAEPHEGPRRVRATYLRVRQRELQRAHRASAAVAPWLLPALAVRDEARRMCGLAEAAVPDVLAPRPGAELGPMSLEQRQRWLTALVGSAAAAWPHSHIADADEPTFAAALVRLSRLQPPPTWTLRDIERALNEDAEAVEPSAPAEVHGDEAVARLALALSRVPPDPRALALVERERDELPVALVEAAADALRLAGELGRARSLLLPFCDQPQVGPIAADVLRRAGDHEGAARLAEATLAADCDRDGRARACLARLRLDAGDLAGCRALVEMPASAATAEVAALCAAASGDIADAMHHLDRGDALATSAEARARLAGAAAYVTKATEPERARRGYRDAVAHAVRAGAVLEEASYRTGEAAACVDLGELEHAIETAGRAALLWEDVLGKPRMAARAWLARAAAYAAIEARAEALHAADEVIARAQGDARAQAYALWAIADASPAGDADGRAAAMRARELVDGEDDAVLAAARLLRHHELDTETLTELDSQARPGTSLSSHARLAYWGARCAALLRHELDERSARHALTQVLALVDGNAPVAARGRAAFAASRIAAAVGDTDAVARLDAARAAIARRVTRSTRSFLAEAARSCEWLARADGSPRTAGEPVVDLERLVRALSERKSLRALLDRVVDVLLMWTGAERGLLLLRDPESNDGALTPRSARNLGRDDLRDEQLAVSTSLAQRALQTGEPVIAVDAMEELSQSYDSVHALQLRSVMAVPLAAQGEIMGVVYLDDRLRRGAFGHEELRIAQAVAPVAALAIADARAQASLRRAVKKAELATRKLEELLATRESQLDVAERALAERSRHPEIVGESEAMRATLRLIDRVAQSDVPVLLLGESGSGKELMARAIHRSSARGEQAFVSENCGALPETLLESALFGHTRGAFTGAHRQRVGLFEAADSGSLFLDEVGEMSLGMQTKLLRVLEDNEVRPVGATRSRKVDVRIIAATHRDLEAMVADGSFREDLYYRLNVISIRIPPLRERPSDVPLLVAHLITKHAPKRNVRVSRAARERLMRFAWPGNVRQLENEIRRALLLCDDIIDVAHLSIPDGAGTLDADLGLDIRGRIDRLECELVAQALERTAGNQTHAAKLLGVSRYGLHKMMKRLDIDPKAHKP